jgi:hypothetical protein
MPARGERPSGVLFHFYVDPQSFYIYFASPLWKEPSVSLWSESAWMSFDQCYAAIRSYNVEKKRLLTAVEQMLSNNFLSKPIC